MANNYQNLTKSELIKALQALESKTRLPAPKPQAVLYDRLLYDLQVHQEELEAQNQALRDAQQLLEESRSRYAELYDLAPLGYVTLDEGGLVREINLTGAAMLGFERSRLIGTPLIWQVVDDDKPIFQKHLKGHSETNPGLTELHLIRNDNSRVHVELHSVPFHTADPKTRGLLTAMTDIGERKRMEQSVYESEALFRAIFAGAGIGMAIIDTQGRLTRTNAALQTMLGYTAAELEVMTFAQMTHGDDRQTDLALYAELLAGARDSYQIEKRYLRKDGRMLWGRLTASLVRDHQGEPRYGIKLVEDITEPRRVAAEILRLNRDLTHHTEELTLANKELESFSYSVSHDLRMPLAAIDQLARVVIEDHEPQLSPRGRRLLDLIHENTLAMTRLIDDLLAFARLSRQALKKQTVSNADLVRPILEKLQSAASDGSVEIVIGDLPPCQADPALLNQVWVNLLSNAFKFTGQCKHARVEIGSATTGGETAYFVKDTCAGFDMEQAGRLFGVFQRLHAEEEYPGNGVGLAIVDRIVRRHGGRVWAEGAVDQGAGFYFTLAAERRFVMLRPPA